MTAAPSQSKKFCPFLPWVPIQSPLQPNKTALSPMACQQSNCELYDEQMKVCSFKKSVSVNLDKKEIKVQ